MWKSKGYSTRSMRGRQTESRPRTLRRDLRSWNVRSMNLSNGSRNFGVPELAHFRPDPQSASLNLNGSPIYFASSFLSFPEILTVALVL